MAILYLQLLLCFGCVLQAIALSPAKGTYYENNADPFPAKDTLDCKDQVSTRRCEFEKARRGCQNDAMRINCAKTCHTCRTKAPAPPKDVDCKGTSYGCCWDGKTTQHGYNGEGCPACEDKKIFAALCSIWRKHCHNTTHAAEYEVVQQNCYKTCNKCFRLEATEQTKVVQTLPPAIGEFANSDDSPRRGAIYVWTKLLNPFGFERIRRT